METSARYVTVGAFTLLSALAVFLFALWLHGASGAGQMALFKIRFETPVLGLHPGAAVLFNGLRVGEVREVAFEPGNPKGLIALIAVQKTTPVGEDTTVGIDSQGLMGSTIVSLAGGAADAPLKAPSLLVAEPEATQSLTQAGRAALKKLDSLLGDNQAAVRDAIANLDAFSQALARNTGRVDHILAGLERMTGAEAPKAAPRSFDLVAPVFEPPAAPVARQIAVREANSAVVFDTQRILTSPAPNERSPLPEGQWSDSLPKLVQAKVAEALEGDGFQGVARSTDGFNSELQLLLEIRAFEVRLTPGPTAEVTIAAKILSADGKIVGARTFSGEAPASGVDAEAAASALGAAFRKTAAELVAWVRGTV